MKKNLRSRSILSTVVTTVCFLVATSANAALVTWGTPANISGASNIVTAGLTNVAGADFGLTTGTTTTVNNGVDNVDFASLNSGQSALLANGVTVTAENTWINFGNNGANSNMTGNYGVILDRNLGIEGVAGDNSDISLSGLSIGTQYQIQFWASATGANSQTISGSAGMNARVSGGIGQYITGTFTADATTQDVTVFQGTGGFAVANAFTIGTITAVPEPSSFVLVGVGLMGLAGFARSRKQPRG